MREGIELLTATQHYITNHAVSVSGDHAHSSCYVLAQHFLRGAEGGSKFMVGGIYSDELVRTAEGWQIARRDVRGVWTSGNRTIALYGPPAAAPRRTP
jgi:hypothetical protein